MIGLGLFIALFGYTVLYWGIQGINKKPQQRFLTYLVPFAK